MNPDDDVLSGALGVLAQELGNDLVYTTSISANTIPLGAITGSTISANAFTQAPNIDDILDECVMNRIAIDHKVSAAELLKLQAVAPDYASEIKENIAKNLAREVAKKVTYTKKHNKDTDVHHFIGRVWVFTEDELKSLLERR
jgi:hypothetical protein